VLFVIDEGVQMLHKLKIGSVTIASVPHQFQHSQFTFKLTVHVQLVSHQPIHSQVRVHGQLHDTVLAVVQLSHKFFVGLVSELVQFAVQHFQSTTGIRSTHSQYWYVVSHKTIPLLQDTSHLLLSQPYHASYAILSSLYTIIDWPCGIVSQR
jgi:hypothetical protein